MNSNKKINASEILGFSSETEKLEFEVSTLHFDFIDEIQGLMDKHSMKSKDLAKELKVSESFISQLFSGDKLLSLKILTKIQKVFDIRFHLSINNIIKDFKPLKELIEGELIKYDRFPPQDTLEKLHKKCCEQALERVSKYFV